jgi:hypothetical protein
MNQWCGVSITVSQPAGTKVSAVGSPWCVLPVLQVGPRSVVGSSVPTLQTTDSIVSIEH